MHYELFNFLSEEMNVKFKMPKFGRKLTGKAWWKELLMTFIATTISIVLTFGTAAWIDNRKKESAKRELVLMILHDMDLSLTTVHSADSALQKGYDLQLTLSQHPEKFMSGIKGGITPIADFHSTTEEIVSSSIETVNTIGNVLFVENVSSFYLLRKHYLKNVVEDFKKEIEGRSIFTNYDNFMGVDYNLYSLLSGSILVNMEKYFNQCKKMMNVSDEELQRYRKKRAEVEQEYNTDSLEIKLQEKYFERYQRLNEAKKSY